MKSFDSKVCGSNYSLTWCWRLCYQLFSIAGVPNPQPWTGTSPWLVRNQAT